MTCLLRTALVAALLVATGASAQQYKRTHVKDKDLCVFWPDRHYVYQPDSAGYSQITDNSVFNAMDAAFQSWQALSDWCSGFTFTKGPRIENAETGYVSGGTNSNVIVFREHNCATSVPAADPCLAAGSCANTYRCWDHPDQAIAITTVTYNTSSGMVLDADIELNASIPAGSGAAYTFTTVDSPVCPEASPAQTCASTDVQNTLTHEIGHVIGLDHVPGKDSTMYATANIGEIRKRIIDNGTAAGFCDIYPRAQASTPICSTTSALDRQITGVSRGTSVPSFSCSAGSGLSALTYAPLLGAMLLRQRGTRRRVAR